MRRHLFLALFVLGSFVLLVLYQNAGDLSKDERFKPLLLPGHFKGIYDDQQAEAARPKSPEIYYNGLLYGSPLYKQLNDTNRPDKGYCDPSQSRVVCPQGDKNAPAKPPPPLTMALDPLRTLATVRMMDNWEGRLHLDNPKGARFEINGRLNESSRLQFETNQSDQMNKVSVEFQW